MQDNSDVMINSVLKESKRKRWWKRFFRKRSKKESTSSANIVNSEDLEPVLAANCPSSADHHLPTAQCMLNEEANQSKHSFQEEEEEDDEPGNHNFQEEDSNSVSNQIVVDIIHGESESRLTLSPSPLASSRDHPVDRSIGWSQRPCGRILKGLSVLFLLLVALFMVYLVYPQDIKYHIDSFELDMNNPTTIDPDGRFVTNWSGKITLINPNYINISVKDMISTAYLNRNRDLAIGYGRAGPFTLRRRDATAINVIFRIPMTAAGSGLPSLVGECLDKESIDLFIKADLDLDLLHWTGIRIKHGLVVNVDCEIPL